MVPDEPDGTQRPPADYVDRMRGDLRAVLPDLDTASIDVFGRIARIGAQVSQLVDRSLAPAGISRAEFEVLSALVRSPRPLRASEVMSTTMLSGASITKLADRLTTAGLLERLKFERDARVVLLAPTAAGRELVERELPLRLDREWHLLADLSPNEVHDLAALLRRVSERVEAAARE
ncbi:MarR family winged helix-turn-helix transcriptional regulator [Aldersonia kunmingensis]|uniref:MarR family winged helix-turn-helix transcriptional regulator n=1 Tax=Aldersonia kunmingensis TaxID=408066 RepID=UPI00082DF1CC|nr:MarR family transcriptional regulator [Aldersonia kunmingensis]